MAMDYILPSGVTIQFSNAAERDAYLGSAAGAGAETQEQALGGVAAPADGTPPPNIRDIASQRAKDWYAPGAQGYRDAIAGGHNDPGSDPAAPQRFDPAALAAAGADPAAYYDRWAAGSTAGGVANWGTRPQFNQALMSYAQSKGYNPRVQGFGREFDANFGNWLRYQPAAVQADMNAWIAANDPGAGGTSVGGIQAPGSGGGLTGVPANPGNSYTPRNYGGNVRQATPAGLAAYYQSQGMNRPYGTTGGEHTFFPGRSYPLPEIIGVDDEDEDDGGTGG